MSKTRKNVIQNFKDDSGVNYMLYLDDTNVAGELDSEVLKDEKITYSGFFVEEGLSYGLEYVMKGLNGELLKRYGDNEFHFTNIYNRRGNFKNIEIKETFEIIDMFVEIIEHFNLLIFTQTSNSDTFSTEQGQVLKDAFKELCKTIKIKHNDKSVGLLLTTLNAKHFLADTKPEATLKGVVCDEGICKPGSTFTLGNAKDKNATKIGFESSKDKPLLQIADFVAWALTRQKVLLSKKEMTQTDKMFLAKISKIDPYYINLPEVNFDINSKMNYDKTHKRKTR